MKLAILSDIHLGKKQYHTDINSINKFEKAGYDIFDQAIDKIIDYSPNLLLYCGDIFETPNPSILALSKFRQGLQRLNNIPSVMILGNHDFSFTNRLTDCSSVKAIIENSKFSIEKFAEYNVEYYIKDNHLFILLPYIYDKIENITALWDRCIELCDKFPKAKKYLVTHGTTEYYTNLHSEFKDRFVLPNELITKFDVVFIGHIHQPFDYYEGDTLVISPGALIDYQADGCYTGPLFFDTDTKEFYREILDTPHLIKKTLDETNINKFLSKIGPYMYKLIYSGDISAIDNDLFILAKNKAINLTLNLVTEEQQSDSIVTKVDSFYNWLKANYPDKLNVFKEATEELNKGV